MKLTGFIAGFGSMLRIPASKLAGLLLALRQGSSKLALEERRFAREARKGGYAAFDWDGRNFVDFLQGESGRYGGVDMTPTVAALFLTAFLVDSPNRTVAEKTLRMFYAPAAEHCRYWDQENMAETSVTVCPVTKQRFWGGALVAVLSNPALLDQVDELHMSLDRELAVLEFVGGAGTHFTRAPLDKTSSYSMHNLPLFVIRPLIDMVNKEAERPSSAA